MMNLRLKRNYVSGKLKLLFTISCALLVICLLIIFLSTKIRKANRELLLRNQQIEVINNDLQRINKELAIQKESITREYTRSVAVRDDKGEFLGALTISRDIT
jgi:cell division protein FtsL